MGKKFFLSSDLTETLCLTEHSGEQAIFPGFPFLNYLMRHNIMEATLPWQKYCDITHIQMTSMNFLNV